MFRLIYFASRCADYGMACRRVPFHGRGEAGIYVSLAFGYQAQLQRTAS